MDMDGNPVGEGKVIAVRQRPEQDRRHLLLVEVPAAEKLRRGRLHAARAAVPHEDAAAGGGGRRIPIVCRCERVRKSDDRGRDPGRACATSTSSRPWPAREHGRLRRQDLHGAGAAHLPRGGDRPRARSRRGPSGPWWPRRRWAPSCEGRRSAMMRETTTYDAIVVGGGSVGRALGLLPGRARPQGAGAGPPPRRGSGRQQGRHRRRSGHALRPGQDPALLAAPWRWSPPGRRPTATTSAGSPAATASRSTREALESTLCGAASRCSAASGWTTTGSTPTPWPSWSRGSTGRGCAEGPTPPTTARSRRCCCRAVLMQHAPSGRAPSCRSTSG